MNRLTHFGGIRIFARWPGHGGIGDGFLEAMARSETGPGDRVGLAVRKIGEANPGGRATVAASQPVTAHEVREVIRARRLRTQFFRRGLFEDPAWDMLLDLFAAELECTQVSVSSLCIAASVAPTTALRWIAKLSAAGLFERHADPFDKRRAFIALSPGARACMQGYFAAMKQRPPDA